MKHSKQRNIKFAVMFVVLAGLVGFLVSEELTGNPNLGAGKTFTLPPANSFKDIGGAQVDVECKIKQELTIVDSDGWTVKTADSSKSAHFEHTIGLTEEGTRVFTENLF